MVIGNYLDNGGKGNSYYLSQRFGRKVTKRRVELYSGDGFDTPKDIASPPICTLNS